MGRVAGNQRQLSGRLSREVVRAAIDGQRWRSNARAVIFFVVVWGAGLSCRGIASEGVCVQQAVRIAAAAAGTGAVSACAESLMRWVDER